MHSQTFKKLASSLFADKQLCGMESCFEHLGAVSAARPQPKFPNLAEVPRSPQKTSPRPRQPTPGAYRQPNWGQHSGVDPNIRTRSANKSSPTDSESDEIPPKFAKPLGDTFGSAGVMGVYPGLLHQNGSSNEEEDDTETVLADPNVELGVLQLIALIVTLCKNLCYGESARGSEGMAVSLAILPHLSTFLASIEKEHPEGDILEGYSSEAVTFLKRHTVRTTITVASFASQQRNGIPSLAASGAIGCLLEVAKLNLAKEGDVSEHVPSCKLILAAEILQGTWLLLHSIFGLQPLESSLLGVAMRLVRQVVESQGLRLLQTSLEAWERRLALGTTDPGTTASEAADVTRAHIVGLVESIGLAISSLKKVKLDYLHSLRCLRARHRTCDMSAYRHHHQDAMGLGASAVSDTGVSGFFGLAQAGKAR